MRIQVINPPEAKLRWVGGLEYSRQLGTDGDCCGPEPGYTYQEEAVRVGVGGEFTLLRVGDQSLSFDARYQPTLYHTIRHGSQPEFQPSPTEWRLNPWLHQLRFDRSETAHAANSREFGRPNALERRRLTLGVVLTCIRGQRRYRLVTMLPERLNRGGPLMLAAAPNNGLQGNGQPGLFSSN